MDESKEPAPRPEPPDLQDPEERRRIVKAFEDLALAFKSDTAGRSVGG